MCSLSILISKLYGTIFYSQEGTASHHQKLTAILANTSREVRLEEKKELLLQALVWPIVQQIAQTMTMNELQDIYTYCS